MDTISTYTDNTLNPELVRFQEGATSDAKGMGEIVNSMEVLTKVDLELAYSSEKLLNLESLLMYIMSYETDFEAMAADDVSVEFIEKSLTIDLLFGFVESEVKELDGSMAFVQYDLLDAHQRLFSCKNLGELFSIVEGKLRDSEDSLKRTKEHVLEMKMQMAKLQMTSLAFNHNECFSEDFQASNIKSKPKLHTIEKVHVLRMLEKSLSRELDLEKKLTESKQDEQDLKLKLRLTEQLVFIMEEAAEVVWGRFLEAENASVVLMGVSRDLVARNQLVQFNLNGYNQREDGFRLKLENCIKLLGAKDASIEKLNTRITQLVADNLEVSNLREKVKSLEEKVNESESTVKKTNESNVSLRENVREMESVIESLKDRAETAEQKAAELTESNMELTESNVELTEELGFVKGSHESSSKKVSLLEKQSRELELQLQHVKASSEVGQEQQNMLYSAIWDMETLIDELKQKVSRAEVRAENEEDRCLMLTDSSSELTKEVEFLRAEIESLERSLGRANVEKMASAKAINVKTNVIMDTVMQLATERERIAEKLRSERVEKRILIEMLQKINKNVYKNTLSKGGIAYKSSGFFIPNLTNSSSERIKVEEIEVLNDNHGPDHDPESELEPEPESSVTDSGSSLDDTGEPQELLARTKRMLVYRAVFFLLISVVAAFLMNRKPGVSDANVV